MSGLPPTPVDYAPQRAIVNDLNKNNFSFSAHKRDLPKQRGAFTPLRGRISDGVAELVRVPSSLWRSSQEFWASRNGTRESSGPVQASRRKRSMNAVRSDGVDILNVSSSPVIG